MEDIMLYNQSGIPDPTATEAIRNIEKSKRAHFERVFISAPLSTGREALNPIVRKAYSEGFAPFAPVLAFSDQFDETDTLHMGHAYMTKCSQVWVVGKPVINDIRKAHKLDKPVRFFTFDAKEIHGE